jgi:undecaprenyl-diphosphatase
MRLMSLLGYQYGVVPVDLSVALWLLLRRRLHAALFFALAVGGAGLLNQVTKWLFGRERPKLWPSLAPEATFSFPSGHAMGAMALVTALVLLLWESHWRYPALALGSLFVLCVSVSRLYLGVHYPSDILAGWLAALAWVMGLHYLLYDAQRMGALTSEAVPADRQASTKGAVQERTQSPGEVEEA